MIDYEARILARQERNEIDEFNGIFCDEEETVHYNPILMRMIEDEKRRKEREGIAK